MYTQRSISNLSGAKKPSKVLMIVSVVLIAVGLIGAIISLVSTPEAKYIGDAGRTGEYVYVETNEILYFDEIYDNDYSYYIVWDNRDYVYIMKMHVEDEKKYDEILSYWFSDSEVVPGDVTIYGVTHDITPAIVSEALGEINQYYTMLQEYVTDEASFYEYFRYFYIDATQSAPGISWILFAAVGAAGIVLLIVSLATKGKSGGGQPALARFGAEAGNIDYELNLPNTLAMDDVGVYITPNYLVSTLGGVQINRLSEISNLSTSFEVNTFGINLSTTDGGYRTIASYYNQQQADAAFHSIKTHLDAMLSAAPQEPIIQQPVIQQPVAPPAQQPFMGTPTAKPVEPTVGSTPPPASYPQQTPQAAQPPHQAPQQSAPPAPPVFNEQSFSQPQAQEKAPWEQPPTNDLDK